MKVKSATIFLLSLFIYTQLNAVQSKREFRGAWLHTVFQEQYLTQNTAQNKEYLKGQLDLLQEAGINAVIFQVRPSADAFYDSKIETWSRFLTKDGRPPKPYWDPMAFMIEECHKRGMEMHAWLNPYRATTSANEKLPAGHIYHRHPERFVKYAKKLYFDPGIPENRKHIEAVVMDIVSRYDIDGIHFDDYFYPYPVNGAKFNDARSFAKYGQGMKLDDWRRHNVDILIKGLHKKIKEAKPWVRFGVSPFGIWRNKKSDTRGSDTGGLQNYDDLYADVLLWAKNGWVDYLMPQLYWTLENKVAPSGKLAYWWNDNSQGRHIYIGQDVERTMSAPDIKPSTLQSQLNAKVSLSRKLPEVQGNCWWPGYCVTDNLGGIADSLAYDIHSTIALPPSYPWLSDTPPHAPSKLKAKDGMLSWKSPSPRNPVSDVTRFVVYQCDPGVDIDTGCADAIIAITGDRHYPIPEGTPEGTTFAVTALDRVNNESEAATITL